MNRRFVIAAALAAAVAGSAVLSAQKPAPAPSFKAEKTQLEARRADAS